MVVMILGILGMTMVPVATSFIGDTRLVSACRVMAGGMEVAAGLSKRYQRPFSVSTDMGLNQFKIIDTAPFPNTTATVRLDNIPRVNADDVVFNPALDQWYVIGLAGLIGMDGIRITAAPASLTFYPDGHSTQSDSHFVLTLGELTRTLTVDAVSARVSID